MEDVFHLYCPACGTKMQDVTLLEKGIEFPLKQCPECLTIYQLGSESKTGAMTAKDVILAPLSKKWLKKNGKKHLKGHLPKSW